MSGHGAARRATAVLWLTGAPGVGKTTVIRRVAEALPQHRLGGFYTEEIRRGGLRQGFRLESFRGGSAVMAHVEFSKRYRVGRYGVDVGAIDELSATALSGEPPADVYLVDEVGRMECLSTHFIRALRTLLDQPCTVVGTIARAGGGLIAELKRRSQIVLWEVTHDNRDDMPARVLSWLDCTDQ
ncbi:MAG: nucleoside-triphosphatase [Woeseia sp.]